MLSGTGGGGPTFIGPATSKYIILFFESSSMYDESHAVSGSFMFSGLYNKIKLINVKCDRSDQIWIKVALTGK